MVEQRGIPIAGALRYTLRKSEQIDMHRGQARRDSSDRESYSITGAVTSSIGHRNTESAWRTYGYPEVKLFEQFHGVSRLP